MKHQTTEAILTQKVEALEKQARVFKITVCVVLLLAGIVVLGGGGDYR